MAKNFESGFNFLFGLIVVHVFVANLQKILRLHLNFFLKNMIFGMSSCHGRCSPCRFSSMNTLKMLFDLVSSSFEHWLKAAT